MSVAFELPLEPGRQTFTASVVPVLVAFLIAIVTVTVVTKLAIVPALVIVTVLRLQSSEC
jgi:hypothetical protein